MNEPVAEGFSLGGRRAVSLVAAARGGPCVSPEDPGPGDEPWSVGGLVPHDGALHPRGTGGGLGPCGDGAVLAPLLELLALPFLEGDPSHASQDRSVSSIERVVAIEVGWRFFWTDARNRVMPSGKGGGPHGTLGFC